MGGYFCIEFIDFMLKSKSLLDYTNLFSPNEYEKNDKIIGLFVASTENSKIQKYHTFSKTLVLSIISIKYKNEDEKIFKEEESIEILKVLGLIE